MTTGMSAPPMGSVIMKPKRKASPNSTMTQTPPSGDDEAARHQGGDQDEHVDDVLPGEEERLLEELLQLGEGDQAPEKETVPMMPPSTASTTMSRAGGRL